MARYVHGITLSYGDGLVADAPTYTPLTGLLSVSLPAGYSVASLDSTNHGSTAKEYKPGLPDYGTISLEWQFDYDDTDHTALQAASFGREQRAWKIELPLVDEANAVKATYTFDGHIEDATDPVAGIDSLLLMSLTIRVSGEPTFTPEALA